MILLAIQYSLQPRVSKKYLDKRINKRSVAMVEEITKMSLATAILSSYGKEKFLAVTRGDYLHFHFERFPPFII